MQQQITASKPVILFDGVCNFCNGAVNFIIRQDKKQMLLFAALQSTAGQNLLGQYHLPSGSFHSFLLIENGKLSTKSTAALKLYGKLPWYWQWTKIFWIVPRVIRDLVYDFIARNRYKWFGQKDACMVPSAEVRSRFLL